jgi:hypothetical protein
MIVNSNNIKIEREGNLESFRGKSTAKSFRSWIASKKGQASKRDNLELVFILNEVERAYNHYEKVGIAKISSWKGKSGIIECIKQPDRVIIKRMRKEEPNGVPKEVEVTITKQELNALISALNFHKDKEWIETKDLAMTYSNILGLNHPDWGRFFSDRVEHNKLTSALCFLESENLIKYSRRGKTKILEKDLSIQLVL